MNRKEMSKCSPNGNQSFPLNINFTPTQEIYDSIKTGFSIEFDWKSRTTLPIFSNLNKCLLDEGGSGTSTPTARFQGMEYTLVSAQVTNATHSAWILNADASSANHLDIICVFKGRVVDTDYPYIFVVIPIISMDSASTESNYLLALAGLCSDKKPYSLENVLPPSDRRFYASYTTCLEPNGANALTLVFINGRYASLKTTNGIYETAGRGPTTPWPSIEVPTDITLTTPSTLTQSQFEKSVRISSLVTREISGAEFRADDTFAYKCVVMDPERDIKDGKLVIDTKTGNPIPLNEVLVARDKVREFEIPISGLKPGQLEKAVAIFLGVLLGLLGLVALYYVIQSMRSNVSQVVFPDWFQQSFGIMITAVLFAFIGFLIGIFIH
jgi:hypothetical protein